MTINVKSLTTIQIEWGTRVLSGVDANPKDAMVATMLCAVMLADTKTLLAARKDESVLDPFIEKAADIPADESEQAVSDFFERWRAYQSRIGRSAGMTIEAGPTPVMTPKPPPVTFSAEMLEKMQAAGLEVPVL